MQSAYWAPEKFAGDLRQELGSAYAGEYGQLILSNEPARELVWAHCVWKNPVRIEISSINDAAKKLRALRAGPWSLAPFENHRRGTLIEEQTRGGRKPPPSKISFLSESRSPLGQFILIEPGVMIAASETSSWVANGEPHFDESSEAPSRAYLKLWEFFTMEGVHPREGETCFDLGASPGGWTWVLAKLGATVTSIDKADLAPHVGKMPNVSLRRADAFKLKPEKLDWLFSDVICEPRRLLALVREWRESGLCENFVCTIKFKGETDFAVLREFLEIPGSHARHLFHNKHEVTWWSLSQRILDARSTAKSKSLRK